MNRSTLVLPLILSLAAHCSYAENAPNKKPLAAATQPRTLEWDDLLPANERNRPPPPPRGIRPLFDDESGPAAQQYGSSKVNTTLNGKLVKIPGFVAPLEMADRAHVKSFFLVPYYGACIHTPPPAPNQIVFVILAKPLPVASLYDARWVTGTLTAEIKSSHLADAAYTLVATKVEKYEEPPE